MHKVFVSNAKEYTGPGVVDVLCGCGYRVVCHDRSFTDAGERAAFGRRNHVTAIAGQTPEEIADELDGFESISRFVFNDAHANAPKPFEEIGIEELKAAHVAWWSSRFACVSSCCRP